jgi:hypothetical protein
MKIINFQNKQDIIRTRIKMRWEVQEKSIVIIEEMSNNKVIINYYNNN